MSARCGVSSLDVLRLTRSAPSASTDAGRRERRDDSAMPAGTRVLPLGLAVVGAAWLYHRIGVRSGVTSAEAAGRLPGDGLVPRPHWQSTRGIDIAARPAEVWRWIVQMGYPTHRAGWYTPEWLDRLQWGIRAGSADRVRPELQRLAAGDVVPDSADGSVFFTVAELQPERALVLHSTRHLLPPARAIDFSWAFVLAPQGAATRLLMRARVTVEPWWARPVLPLVIGPGDYLNASAMLRGIRRRAELPG
jgi:hypothetical protein